MGLSFELEMLGAIAIVAVLGYARESWLDRRHKAAIAFAKHKD